MYLKKIFAVSALVALLAVPIVSFAATFKAGDHYTLRSNETVEGNFYSAGGNVTIDGTVNGDLVAAGGNVIVTGTVNDDVMIVGGDVDLDGTVNGDVRIIGGNIKIRGTVKGEVTVAGGSVMFISTSKSEKDVMIAGGEVSIAGEIMGDLTVRSGQAVVSGHLAKSANIRVGEKLTLASGAVIDGGLNYKAPKEVIKEEGSQVKGETKFEKSEDHRQAQNDARKGFLALLGIWFLIKLVSMTIAGILLVYFGKNYVQEMLDRTLMGFGKEAFRGFLFLIITPIAALVLCLTLIGIVPGFMLLILYVLLVIFAKVLTGILLGTVLERLFNKAVVQPVSWKTVVGGNVVLAVVAFIPILGWLTVAIFFVAALGGWVEYVYSKLRQNA